MNLRLCELSTRQKSKAVLTVWNLIANRYPLLLKNKMDITTLFKACVKTVRTTNKSLGLNNNTKNDILKDISKKDVNLIKAREIVRQISNFRKILDENKTAYMNVLNYLSTNKTMSEVERENIDSAAEKIINSCSSAINDLKKEICAHRKSKQKQEHYENVIESLEKYLKIVSKNYAEIKARRVKRVIETHKISKLETNKSLTPAATVSLNKNETITNKSALQDSSDISPKNKFAIPPHTPPVEDVNSQLSAEELQMFESENQLLYNELNSLSDEVKQIEGKVVHIAELQELFTEKVLQQDRDIERIATAVVTATDNVRGANEQIRQAIQRNAGLRVWILFFLLVMSFSLLFLDWYND